MSSETWHLRSHGKAIEGVHVVLTRCVTYFHNGRVINRNLEALAALALVSQGAIAINQPQSKLVANDKILSLAVLASRGITVPPTVFAASAEETAEAARTAPCPAVIKLTEGLWGAGVMRVDSEASFRSVSEAFVNLGHAVLMQPYLLGKDSQQLRVLVLGDEILAAYETSPRGGDFRGNLRAGAKPTPVTVSPQITTMALASAKALGLDFAGVDLIVHGGTPYVLEVNPAPGFDFARTMPDVDVGGSLVAYFDKLLGQPRCPSDVGFVRPRA
jgi:ribosomal protein S6--L-glutamate ligase